MNKKVAIIGVLMLFILMFIPFGSIWAQGKPYPTFSEVKEMISNALNDVNSSITNIGNRLNLLETKIDSIDNSGYPKLPIELYVDKTQPMSMEVYSPYSEGAPYNGYFIIPFGIRGVEKTYGPDGGSAIITTTINGYKQTYAGSGNLMNFYINDPNMVPCPGETINAHLNAIWGNQQIEEDLAITVHYSEGPINPPVYPAHCSI